MSNTGNLNQGNTLTYDGGNGIQEFDVTGLNAQQIVELVNPQVTIPISVSQAQNWLDEQIIDCSQSQNADCEECQTCDEQLQPNEYYNEFDISPNPRNASAFLSINGVNECWDYVIS